MRGPLQTTRRRAACAGLASLALAGCTFLVDFVTKATPDDCDGADCVDAMRPDIVLVDTAEALAAEAAVDGQAPDVHVDAAQCPNPCKNRDNGWYCGTDFLFCVAPADDLYRCTADAVADVTHCAQGSGCLQLPNGHPDTCDPCPGRPNGRYCGRDLPMVPHEPGLDKNDIFIFGCVGGRFAATGGPCNTGCTGSPNAVCNPN